jgi:hypothetical protein
VKEAGLDGEALKNIYILGPSNILGWALDFLVHMEGILGQFQWIFKKMI